MEIVCNECGFKRSIGTIVHAKEVFVCTECQSTDVKLVDTGGINIKVDGINEDTIVNIIKELAKNVSVYDIFGFLAKQGQGQIEEKDKDEDGDK